MNKCCKTCIQLRSYILLLSGMTKQIVLLELTVPMKERMEAAHRRKKVLYKMNRLMHLDVLAMHSPSKPEQIYRTLTVVWDSSV